MRTKNGLKSKSHHRRAIVVCLTKNSFGEVEKHPKDQPFLVVSNEIENKLNFFFLKKKGSQFQRIRD